MVVSPGGWTGRAECVSSELNITGSLTLCLSPGVRRSPFLSLSLPLSLCLCLCLPLSLSLSPSLSLPLSLTLGLVSGGIGIFSPKVRGPQSHGHSLFKKDVGWIVTRRNKKKNKKTKTRRH